MQKKTILTIFGVILGIIVLFFLLALGWHFFAFKYIFQFMGSFGLLLLGFYYLLRANVPNNIQKGILLLVFSLVFFLLCNVILFSTKTDVGQSDQNYTSNSFPTQTGSIFSFFNKDITLLGNGIKSWHIFLIFAIITNAIALARNPRPRVFLAVTLVSLAATIVITLLSK